MKILFVNPPYYRLAGLEYIYIPLGICSLSAVTKNAGYETFVYNMDVPPIKSELFTDYQVKYRNNDERDLILMNLKDDPLMVWKELNEVLDMIRPDVVGISSLTSQVPPARKVAEICKIHNPHVLTIIGGAHAYFCAGELLQDENIDYVFSGEAEDGILEFLNAVKDEVGANAMKRIKGLSYKDGNSMFISKERPLINVGNYPMPSRELFVFPERYQPENMAMLLTGRGCPFHCNFCASPNMSGSKVRQRPTESVIDEIEHILTNYNIKRFMFWEDTFITSKGRLMQFCKALSRRKIEIVWRCHTRLDTLNEEIIDTLKENGCQQINVGIETGSEKILKYINKRISLKKITEKIDLLKKKEMIWSGNFMIGFPEETKEDIEETVDFIRSVVKNHIALGVCIPYPGSKFYEDCISLGIIDTGKPMDWTLFTPTSKYACFSSYLEKEELHNYIETIKRLVSPYMFKTEGAFSPCERIHD